MQDDFAEAIDALLEQAEATDPPPTELRISATSPIAAAQQLLAKAQIQEPPVPVEDIAIRCGVRLVAFAGEIEVSGLLVALESGAVIAYNADEGKPRRRFTIAHELGHLLLRHYEHFHIDPRDITVEGHPPDYDWRDERAANDFAAELLMPAAWVTERHATTTNLARLAKAFTVSRQAMQYRLINLGLA